MKHTSLKIEAQLNNPLSQFLEHMPRGSQLKSEQEASMIEVPNESIRSLPPETRLRLLSQLRLLHVTLNRDVALWEFLLDLLEDSYAGRLPTAANIQKEFAAVKSFSTTYTFADESKIEASGGALIGISGAGKTRTIKRLLAKLPQTANHSLSDNPLLPPVSIIWLRVECPANHSLIALSMAVFEAIEQAIKEDIPSELKKGNESVLSKNVANLCAKYKLGVLIIDEIQHILDKHGKPDDKVLNSLVALSNQLEVPLLIIGTPLARKVIGGKFRQARRMIGPDWKNFKRESQSWTEFSSKLQQYQYTQLVVSHESIEETLYDLSQGIPSMALLLWRLSQRYVILMELDGHESPQLTPVIIKAAFDDYFESVKPMIDALRSDDAQRIALYQDLRMDSDSIENQMANAAADQKEAMRMKLFKTQKAALAKGKNIIKSATIAQAHAYSQSPIPPETAPNPLLEAFDKAKAEGTDSATAVKEVI